MNRNLSLGYDQGQGKMEAHKFIKSQHNGNCQYSLLLSLYLTQTKKLDKAQTYTTSVQNIWGEIKYVWPD